MKHDRAPALNRFENELARAIDARAGRSAVRRNARVLALASLVVLALVAGVTYAWSQARDTSTGVATSGPDDSGTTGAPPEELLSGDGTVVLQVGGVGDHQWALQLRSDRGAVCVELVSTVRNLEKTASCGTSDELESALVHMPSQVLSLGLVPAIGGNARAEVARIDLVDADDAVLVSVATTTDERVPGGRFWATDADVAEATSVVARDAAGDEVGRMPAPPTSVRRTADLLAIRRAAEAGIIGIGTEDPDLFIDDPRGIKAQRDALAAAYPEQIGNTSLVMHDVTFTSSTQAEFVYDVLLAPPLDTHSLHGLVGHAVRIDGVWKVTRATACQVWGFGTGTCPPPE
jgi:hypothetical protein